jgi:hypothetical protein
MQLEASWQVLAESSYAQVSTLILTETVDSRLLLTA